MPDAAPIAPLPGDSRQGGHPWIEWFVLAIAVAIAFGAVVPDFFQAADDLLATGVMHAVEVKHPRLLDRIGAVVFSDEGQGHFRPTQDFVYVLLYAAFGPERWIFACMVIYALCHFASGLLLAAILRRLGCNRAVAFAGALLFALHPTYDENLASVQFGNNIPGLAAVLAAAFLWLPASTSKGREALRLSGACFFLLLAIGLGINLMVSGAVLLGLMTVVIARQRRSIGTLFARGLVLAVPLGLGALHRLLAYGALSTKHPMYQNMERGWDRLKLLLEVPHSGFLLMPSPMAPWTALKNPPGLSWDDGSLPIFSLDGAIVLVTAIGLCAVVLYLRRAGSRATAAPAAQRLAPGFWFGVALAFAMLFPYYAFVGRAGPHRYNYPSMAGFAAIAATAGAALFRKLGAVLPERVVVAAAGVVLAFVLACLLRVDREAARSIASGHRVARAVTSAVIEDVRKNPALHRVYALGYPRMIGRAGHSIVFPSHLRAVVNAVLNRTLVDDESEYHADLMLGRLALPLPPDAAVYLVEPDGVTVRRLPANPEPLMPDYARGEGFSAIGRAWRLDEDPEVLAGLMSHDRTVVDTVLRVLVQNEGFERKYLIPIAFLDSRGSPLLSQAALALAAREPNGPQLVARTAVLTRSPEVETAAIAMLGNGNPKLTVEGARRAVKLERDAEDLARRGGTTAENLKAFETAQAAWREVGVARDDLYDSMSFSRLLDLDEAGIAATGQDWASRGWTRLAMVAASFGAARRAASIEGFSIGLAPRGVKINGGAGPIALEAVIRNDSDLYVPGAASALSGRLVWTAVASDGTRTTAGEQWLPPEGIDPHAWKRVMASVIDVPVPDLTELHVDLIAYGKKCASATWSIAKQAMTAASTEKK